MTAGSSSRSRHLGRRVLGNHACRRGAARQEHVDRHRRVGQIVRHHSRQRFDGRARRAVGDEPPPRHRLLVHRDVDDPSGAGGHHSRRHRPGDQEHPRHLRVDHVAEAFRRDLPEPLWLGEEARIDRAHPDAGVVDEHVESAELIPELVDRGADRRVVADVERHAQGFAPEPVRGGLRPGRTSTGDDDAGARGAQSIGHRRTEAAGRPGDQHARARELVHGRGAYAGLAR